MNKFILDVRNAHEYNSGHITGAINIPVDELQSRLNELPKRDVYVHCQSGMRSSRAKGILEQNGFSVIDLGSFSSAVEYFSGFEKQVGGLI